MYFQTNSTADVFRIKTKGIHRFPLIAGIITTILFLKAKYVEMNILLAIIINIVFVYLVLRSSDWIGKKLGKSGAEVLRKVFGAILLAIAVKLFKDNFFSFKPTTEGIGFLH